MNQEGNESADIAPLEWVTGDLARGSLDRCAAWHRDQVPELTMLKRLRKIGLSSAQSAAVCQQVILRSIADKKFSRSSEMFFDRVLLQQATDERLAMIKAQRFPPGCSVVDICCGLGGDLLALCKRGQATGVDASRRSVHLARVNCRVHSVPVELKCERAEQLKLNADNFVHVDPDRRTDGRRTTKLEHCSPSRDFLEHLISGQRNVAIKLAPATDVPESWSNGIRQWLGDSRECKQQVVWFGRDWTNFNDLKTTAAATAIDSRGQVLFHLEQAAASTAEVASVTDDFVYEPHPTVIAARMVDGLADRLKLKRVSANVAYLTGPLIDSSALTGFRVLETCPLNPGKVKAALGRLDAGQIEIKKRGVEHHLMEPFARLKLKGSRRLTLLLTRFGDNYVAIIGHRMNTQFS